MTKNKLISFSILAIIIWIIFYIYYADFSPKQSDDLLLEKISKLEQKIDSLSDKKDSVRTIILTVDKEIIKNEKQYEEVVNNIISQSSNADSVFARDYIQKFIDQRIR